MPASDWQTLNSSSLINVDAFTVSFDLLGDALAAIKDIVELDRLAAGARADIALDTSDVVSDALTAVTNALSEALGGFALEGGAHVLFVKPGQRTLPVLATLISDSLGDTNDLNRPDLDENSAVAGVCITFGAEDYKNARDLGVRMKMLTRNPNSEISRAILEVNGLPTIDEPTPTGLEAVARTSKTGSPEIVLRWDPFVSVTKSTRELNTASATATITGVKVIRDVVPFPSGTYSTELYSPDFTSFDVPYPGNGLPGYFVDDTVTSDVTYYYAVAYTLSYGGTAYIGSSISNEVDATARPSKRTFHAKEPYWVSANGLLPGIFPAVSDAADYMTRLVSQLTASSESPVAEYSSRLDSAYAFEVNRLNILAEQVEGSSATLASLVAPLSGGEVGTFAFYTDAGLTDLRQLLYFKLQDSNDPNLPSTPYTGALVFLATSENADAALTVYNTLSVMFGISSPASPPLLAALESVNVAIGTLEAQDREFNAELTSLQNTVTTTVTDPPTILELP